MQKWRNNSQETKATYGTWTNMRRRCLNPAHPHWMLYGGRGIKICDRWVDDYDAFFDDMGLRPAGYTIERRDNDEGYNPGNCYWASRKEQAQNRHTARMVTIEGRTQSITSWLKEIGASETTFYKKLKAGVPLEKALHKKQKRNRTPQHGTNSMYSFYGCRCTLCKQAGKMYREQLRCKRLQYDL